MQTFTRGITLPLLRPMPIPTPVDVAWYNIIGQIETLSHRLQARNWKVEENYLFWMPWLQVEVCIPIGFIFDGASVPRALWSFMAPTGIMFLPGLFHDFGYRYNCWLDRNYKPIFDGAGQKFFDEQIRRLGIYCNNATTASNTVYASLKMFGFIAWNERREENCQISIDFPVKK